MHPVAPSGSAPFALSVLDNAHTGVGQTAQETFAEIIALAQLAERRGYHRFWMSEHHAMPAAATSSPQMMLARLTGETERIRLGAGGVMLPNHVPLLIAEQFGMLETLAPGRIDLGLGRAPGTDHATAAALRRGREANDTFPEQVLELLAFLEDDFPDGHPYRGVHAVPGPWQAEENQVARPGTPEAWILGSSPFSAQLAGQLGRPYAFALQFGDADIVTALNLYRDSFRPSETLSEPHTLVSIGVVAHDDASEARRQAHTAAMAMLRMLTRKSYRLLTPEESMAYSPTVQEQQILDMYLRRFVNGTGEQVAEHLDQLHDATGVDEIMLVTMGHSREVQSRTLELIADHYGLPRL
ncbi:LLM class flavin-dependent oxidoreductase [Brachybacterium sp. EE-P12]|uniref:LLM class flavin-dependent oxidoreductase n=1 Tax=Candidatus Brachybacterium intestinipullorum TaxID=2838512 RepID=A0A9D2Q111_9MICO|nr:LLM class flavin-dependent oxidoreductase [Brachybacterium sp. EE-P12]HJC68940.1 LLM class flavin-dependent oxidoreductase [Candidatus Brachybacterium intestinipullorum]